ncbi:MAG: sulfatase-like hydrolase/transferase, partial [Bacteroidota bacterium]
MHPQLRFALTAALVMLAANFLFRFIFFLYNIGTAEPLTFTKVFHAFWVGIRFDLATIAICSGWILLISALPLGIFRKKRAHSITIFLLIFTQVPVLLINGLDVVYYGFSSKRLTHELFTSKGDAGAFTIHEMIPYWWLFLIFFITLYVMTRLLKRSASVQRSRMLSEKGGGIHQWLMVLIFAGILFVAFRGGLQRRPLRPAMAFSTSSLFLGNVGLNSAYTVISCIDIGKEKPMNIVNQAEAVKEVRAHFHNEFDGPYVSEEYPLVRRAEFEGPEQHYNVVVLIIESLNAAKTGILTGKNPQESLTPNFDTLTKHGLLFSNYYSNASRSVEALPAILNSIPDIFRRPLIGSTYETNATWGIGNILESRNYHTSFFCGGPNGTMGFDHYSAISGFSHYFGKNEFPHDKTGLEGNWGLHDNPIMQWKGEEEGQFPEPFLSTFFSISNHHPFKIPGDCPEFIRRSDISDMEKTIMYTD